MNKDLRKTCNSIENIYILCENEKWDKDIMKNFLIGYITGVFER